VRAQPRSPWSTRTRMRDVTQDVTPPPGRDAPKFMNPFQIDVSAELDYPEFAIFSTVAQYKWRQQMALTPFMQELYKPLHVQQQVVMAKWSVSKHYCFLILLCRKWFITRSFIQIEMSWWSKCNATKLTTINASRRVLTPRWWRVYRSDQSWNSVSAVKLM